MIYNMKKNLYTSSFQNKSIQFNCVILANILDISNDGCHVVKMKIIPIIDGFVYDDMVIMHTSRHDFAPDAKN